MTNTEIRRANVATLRKEAKARDIDIDGMNRADLVDALLEPDVEKPEPEKVETVKMVNAEGVTADVHPDMVEDYRVNGGFRDCT